MATTQDGDLPTSLEEVENLITELYQPTNTQNINKVQETLQRLQKSSEGWQLATAFMHHGNEHIRFFAALTFIVKINTDGNSLNETDITSLLNTLLGWLISSMEASEGTLVVRKLSSVFVTYWMTFFSHWTLCVKHLIYCLCVNRPEPYTAMDNIDEQTLVDQLPQNRVTPILWICAALVEEVGKTDSNSMKQNQFHRLVRPNIESIIPLLHKYIANDSANIKDRQEAMKCYLACVSYSHRAFIDHDESVMEPLRTLTQPALQCLGNDDLYEITIELFSDILQNYSTFLREGDFEILRAILNSEWTENKYKALVGGDYDFDSLQFGTFLIAFGDATVTDLVRSCNSPQQAKFLTLLAGLVDADGLAVAEDRIYVPGLEFWSTFVETILNETYEDKDPEWMTAAQSYVDLVIERCFKKSQFPPADIYNTWDDVEKTSFKDARRDFADLLQQYYITTGIRLLYVFVTLIIEASDSKNWTALEAALFCMSYFEDSTTDVTDHDRNLNQVFTPALVEQFSRHNEIPTRLMKSFLDLVVAKAEYFGRESAQLPAVLNIVFVATGSKALSKTAATAIMKICSDCRKTLFRELNTFLQHYVNIASNHEVEGLVKEAVIQGISSIIQALENDEQKVAALTILLDCIENDVKKAHELLSTVPPFDTLVNEPKMLEAAMNQKVVGQNLAILALKCLEAIAKGIQVPNDVPVDLDTDGNSSSSLFWTLGAGHGVQERIYGLMTYIFNFHDPSYIEYIISFCAILRLGFREMEPGPFVFPPEMVAEFLMKTDTNSKHVHTAVSTMSQFISAQKAGGKMEVVTASLLVYVARLVNTLVSSPSRDPETSQACIEFFTRMLLKCPQVFMSYQPAAQLESLFMFALQALTATEPLVKQTAAEFWATFVNLSGQPSDPQPAIDDAMLFLGPLLAKALIFNIGGMAARSDLERLCEPIKKLVIRQLHAKEWLNAALFDQNFPSQNVEAKEKTGFVERIINLRGARGTNKFVKDFWLQCRGSNFAYAS